MGRFIIVLMALAIAASSANADEKAPDNDKGQVAVSHTVAAESLPIDATLVYSYVDENRDGINDLFQDANGDGINDITLSAYAHHFGFVDANGDGINDVFVDRDGDGVNDLNGHFFDADGDGICDNVIDYDGNGVNDITGIVYHHQSLEGFRFGRMDEERGAEHHLFIDEDGDGMNDSRLPDMMHPVNGMDIFIDEDGDGICDGRNFMRPRMPVLGVGRAETTMPGRGHMGGNSESMDSGRKQHQMGGGK
ncbi:MAG: hypothetical protein ACI8V2_002687 [Candidatus Latescibacterota bacterium]|jgi:hypothetical protein